MLDLGKSIRIVRNAKGIRQSRLAKEAGISPAMLSLLEGGEREPSLRVLRALATALDVPPEALIVLAQPVETKLKLTDERAEGLARCIRKMVDIEDQLRASLETGSTDAPTECNDR